MSDDLYDLGATTSSKSSSAKKKGIVLESGPVQEAHDQWIDAKRQLTDSKAAMEQAENNILEYAEKGWRNECQSAGVVENSVKMGSIRITWKGKSQFFVKSSIEGERINATFNEDESKRYFKTVKGPMQLTEEAVNNPEIKAKLVELISSLREDFPGVPIIEFKSDIVPTDNLMHDFVMDDKKKDQLTSQFDAAGLRRTKTTMSGR